MRRSVTFLLPVAALLAACPEEPQPPVCEAPCGEACCAQGQSCFEGACCVPSCEGRECGSDGCGGTCALCAEGRTCNEETGKCDADCVRESDSAFCDRLAKAAGHKLCGSISDLDNCGEPRSWNCGFCALPSVCNIDTHTCECTPETDEEICQLQMRECGQARFRDRCGKDRTVTSCGSCSDGRLCNFAGRCDTCVHESDEQMCQRLKKNCGAVTATDTCTGLQRTVASCGKCSSGQVCSVDNVCGAAGAPRNDECPGAEELFFDSSGSAITFGDTTLATHSGASGKCSNGGGNDVVYFFSVGPGELKNLTASVAFDSASVASSIYLRKGSCTSAEVGCMSVAGPRAVLSVQKLGEGTYWLWVDAKLGSKGPFTLDAQLDDALPTPEGDRCDGEPLPEFGEDGKVQVVGSTGDAANDLAGQCVSGGMPGYDVAYSFRLEEEASITAKVAANGRFLKPALYLRSACASVAPEDQIACATGPTGVASTIVPKLVPGTYYLLVDSAEPIGGEFTLEVAKGPVIHVPDNCASPAEVIVLDESGRGSATGDTSLAKPDFQSLKCSGGEGKDVVYAFTTTAPASDLTVTLTYLQDASIKPVFYVRKDCAANTLASEILCAKGSGGATLSKGLRDVPAGTYYVWVDAEAGQQGTFQLDVAATAALANDACAAPVALDLSAGSITYEDDTSVAEDDGKGTCGGLGPDLTFTFTLDAPKAVSVEVTPLGTAAKPALYLRTTCATEGAEVADTCAAASVAGGPAKLFVPVLQSGTYYLWVDGMGTAAGKFKLELTADDLPPPPANDACGMDDLQAVALEFDATTAKATVPLSDMTYASNDAAGSCAPGGGPDLVYSFSIESPKKVTAKLVRDASATRLKPSVYLRAACASAEAAKEVTCGKGSSTGTATAVANNLPAGKYFVWVDSEQAGGAFTLEVALEDPITTAPANESCFAPAVLGFSGTPPSASVLGTTSGAQNESNGSCANELAPDLVYAFTTPARHQITALVEPLSSSTSYRPAVYLRSACASRAAEDELACASASTAGGVAKAVINDAPAGRYYLWVDGGGSTSSQGTFAVTVNLGDPRVVPTNDTCSRPETVALNATFAGDTTLATNDYTVYPGRDLVYAYTPQSSGYFTVTATPAAGYDVALWVTEGICGGTASDRTDANGDGEAESLRIDGVAGATYFIFVDGFLSSEYGPFQLTLD